MPEVAILSSLGGLGALLAVPASGVVLARTVYARRYARLGAVDRAALSLSIGLAATTIYLVVLSHAGIFHPALVGGPGWLLAATLATRRLLNLRLHVGSPGSWRGRLEPLPALAGALALLLPFAYLPGVDESVLVGRDQQLYLDMGVKLAQEGRLDRTLIAAGAGDRELLMEAFRIGGEERHIVPGTFAKATREGRLLTPFLPAGYSGWVGVMALLAGAPLAQATNVFVWPLVLWLTFVLARRTLGEPLALAACAIAAFLPTTFWSAGLTLSEPLAAGLAVALATSMVHVRRRAEWVGPFICLAGAMLIRLDSLLLGFAMTIALAMRSWQAASLPSARGEALDGSMAVVLSTTIVLAFYWIWYPFYIRVHSAQVLGATTGIALGIVLACRRPRSGRRLLGNPRVARSGLVLVAAALALGLGYAAIVRPTLEPYAIIANGTEIDGMRDFREDSLRNLAVYVSWPAIVLAFVGVIVAVDRAIRDRATLTEAFVWLAFVTTTVLFLAYPQVSPDHPFAIRRFVPVVIPGIIFFACFALLQMAKRISGRSAIVVAPAVALAAIPFLSADRWEGMHLAEGSGTSLHVVDLAGILPAQLVIADLDLAALATSLVLRHGHAVIPVSYVDSDRSRILRAWSDARHAAGGTVPLLHRPGSLPSNAELEGDPKVVSFDRVRVLPEWTPPARSIVSERVTLQLSQVRVMEPRVDRIFGGAPLWGAVETGFLRPEVAPFGTFRWTDGAATIVAPIHPDDRFDRMKIDLFALERPGRSTHVEISVNGKVALQEALTGGITTRIVTVPIGDTGNRIELRISSDTATPKSLGIGSSEQKLGVGIVGLRMLRDGEPTSNLVGAGLDGFRFRLVPLVPREPFVVEAGRGDVVVPLTVSNEGALPWPTLRESGRIDGAVQIGARWYGRGDRTTVLADQRWTLELGLYPGDRTTLAARFAPADGSGRRFPPGSYDLELGVVREAVGWLPAAPNEAIVVAVDVR